MADLATGIQFLERLGFADIVLWLLSFALVYGLLSHIGKKGMPESNVARAIIGIVAAFFVLLSVPAQLITILSSMSTSLIVLVLGIITFMIFLELAEVKAGEATYTTKDGKTVEVNRRHKITERHPQLFAALLIIFAVLIFVAAGGLNLLGLNILLNSSSTTTLIILGVIVLAVYWLIKEKNE